MNQRHPHQPEREVVSPDYSAFHDVEVVEVTEVRHGISLVKRIVEFIMTCRAPGIVAVLTPFALWRLGHSMSECGDKLSTNALWGNIASIIAMIAFGGVGLFLDWTHHATISQKPSDLAAEPGNGGSGAAKAGSSP